MNIIDVNVNVFKWLVKQRQVHTTLISHNTQIHKRLSIRNYMSSRSTFFSLNGSYRDMIQEKKTEKLHGDLDQKRKT